MQRLCLHGNVPWASTHPLVGGSDVIVRLLLQRAQCACVVLLLDVELLSEGVVHRLDLVDGDPAADGEFRQHAAFNKPLVSNTSAASPPRRHAPGGVKRLVPLLAQSLLLVEPRLTHGADLALELADDT